MNFNFNRNSSLDIPNQNRNLKVAELLSNVHDTTKVDTKVDFFSSLIKLQFKA